MLRDERTIDFNWNRANMQKNGSRLNHQLDCLVQTIRVETRREVRWQYHRLDNVDSSLSLSHLQTWIKTFFTKVEGYVSSGGDETVSREKIVLHFEINGSHHVHLVCQFLFGHFPLFADRIETHPHRYRSAAIALTFFGVFTIRRCESCRRFRFDLAWNAPIGFLVGRSGQSFRLHLVRLQTCIDAYMSVYIYDSLSFCGLKTRTNIGGRPTSNRRDREREGKNRRVSHVWCILR